MKELQDATEVLRIYLKLSDSFYAIQKKHGVKFTKGRLKFRSDMKKSVHTALASLKTLEKIRRLNIPDKRGARQITFCGKEIWQSYKKFLKEVNRCQLK
ncbi:MAG: hypothetical protein WC208_14075 [Gallionella sp.]|jgi:hypothetical protein